MRQTSQKLLDELILFLLQLCCRAVSVSVCVRERDACVALVLLWKQGASTKLIWF